MAARPRFRTLRKFLAPRWLTEGEGGLVGYSLDLIKDAFVERLRLGFLAGFPQNGPNGETAPEDALALIGRDRRVVRGIDESAESYAYRLTQWLVDRRRTGNPFALMKKLAEYTGPGVAFRTVDVRGNWYSRDEDGVETSSLATGNWDWDGDTARWSRFWVIVYPGALWSAESTWGAGTWGAVSTGTWGSTMTPEHAASMHALVADWKPAGTRCAAIILALDPASFDPTAPEPDGLWGRWSKVVASTQVASRLATGRYVDGVPTP